MESVREFTHLMDRPSNGIDQKLPPRKRHKKDRTAACLQCSQTLPRLTHNPTGTIKVRKLAALLQLGPASEVN